jgi:hypothetical protein
MVNVVGNYKDGVGNLAKAIQWDGDTSPTSTWGNITAWTKRAHLDKRNVLGIQAPQIVQHVGVGDWLVMDSRRDPQVFPMTAGQFASTYVVAT